MYHYTSGQEVHAGDLVAGQVPGTGPVVGEVVCVDDATGEVYVACSKVEHIGPNQDMPLHGLYFGPGNLPFGVSGTVVVAPVSCFAPVLVAEAGSPDGSDDTGKPDSSEAGKPEPDLTSGRRLRRNADPA